MGQILHGSATATEAVRRAIQHSQASLRALAKRYGINPKTVAKWKKRKRDVTAAGHCAAITCEAARLHFHGSSSSIFVLG